MVEDDPSMDAAERRVLRLLSIMRHELLVPLSVIEGFVELMDPEPGGVTPPSEETDEAVEAIRRNVRLALLLVNRLQYADEMLDQKGMNLEREIDDVVSVVCEIVDDVRHTLLAERDVTVEAPDHEILASLDKARIRQVLFNLLSNAVKYSDSGTAITIEVDVQDEDVVIRVADQGLGIAPSDIEAAFQAFSRLTDDTKGIGLGLAISRAIARAHGGDLTAEPAPTGPGTRLLLRLPPART
jgi:signal transduction histidine kinase